MSTLSQLGLTIKDVIDDLLDLNENDGWSCEADNNPLFPGDVWICKKFLHNVLIYIKLKLKIDKSSDFLLIMSFHIDGN